MHHALTKVFEIYVVIDVERRRQQRVDLFVDLREFGVALVHGRLHGRHVRITGLLLEALTFRLGRALRLRGGTFRSLLRPLRFSCCGGVLAHPCRLSTLSLSGRDLCLMLHLREEASLGHRCVLSNSAVTVGWTVPPPRDLLLSVRGQQPLAGHGRKEVDRRESSRGTDMGTDTAPTALTQLRDLLHGAGFRRGGR